MSAATITHNLPIAEALVNTKPKGWVVKLWIWAMSSSLERRSYLVVGASDFWSHSGCSRPCLCRFIVSLDKKLLHIVSPHPSVPMNTYRNQTKLMFGKKPCDPLSRNLVSHQDGCGAGSMLVLLYGTEIRLSSRPSYHQGQKSLVWTDIM